ncbi:methylmalonyl-CoA epimerase [Saccharomonospora viridis]|jgi:methylmalonyl-CoA/ethylmalonyl-CoA epimerase|nr:glyoxalase [Saccharomonospora viridis]SFP42505.1 methylmalonyl-CoA epimerase [Saccharomonospora viridis]
MIRRYRFRGHYRSRAIDVTLTPTDVMPILLLMQQALQPFVTAVDHVGVAVADLDAAIAFHTEHFGLEVTHVEVNEEQGVREAMLRAPGDADGTAIQLLAPLNDESTIAKFLDRNGPGLQQLAYRVTDVEAAAEALRNKGLRVLYPQARRGTAGSKVNFVHPKDAGGVLVELVQPGDEH